MRTKATLAFLGILVLIGIFLLVHKPAASVYRELHKPDGRAEITTASSTDSYDVFIKITDAGFQPNEITIREGERVRFVNDSTRDRWPASAVHPTHSLYPGKSTSDCLGSAFDSCRGLRNGEAFSFTFYYAGEWRYHDHLDASKTGVIIVEPR